MSERDERIHHRPGPFEHVLVATDFSAGARRALARAARLPFTERGQLSVLHVLPDAVPEKVRVAVEEEARRQLDSLTAEASEALAELGRGGVQVSPRLGRGQPYVELIRHARLLGAELVVLGRHGRRPVKDMFVGSTAARVIRAGDLPVLLVSRPARGGYRRPLVAVDLKDTDRALAHLALRVIGPDAKAVAMVHAYQVPFEGFVSPTARRGESTELRKEYKRTAAADLQKVLAALDDFGVRWATSIVHGDPRVAILLEANRRRTDLIAVGTHGRTGIARVLIGSVSEWVIEAAQCDVLVARVARQSFEMP